MSQKSFIPRSMMVNLTVDVFGSSINLFQGGARAQGLEDKLEQWLRPSQDSTASSVRARRSVSDSKLDRIAERANFEQDSFRLSSFLRIYGNDVFYNEMTDLPNMEIDFKSWGRTLARGVSNEEVFTRSFMIVDSKLTFPTAAGLPLDLDLEATTTLSLKYSGKLDMRQAFKFPPKVAIDGHIDPSAATLVRGTLSCRVFGSQTGGRMDVTIHSATSLAGKVEIIPRDRVHFHIGAQRQKQEIISVATQLFTVKSGEAVAAASSGNVVERSVCSPEQVQKIFGSKLCLEAKYPTNMNPFTGPMQASFYLEKTDTHSGYDMQLSVETGTEDKLYVVMDTPDAQQDRLISATLSRGATAFGISLQSPWKQFSLDGTITNRLRNKQATAIIKIDNVEQYNLAGRFEDTGNTRRTNYKLTLTSVSGGQERKVTATYLYNPGVKAKVALKMINIFEQVFDTDTTLTINNGNYVVASEVKSQFGDADYRGSVSMGNTNSLSSKLIYTLPGKRPQQIALNGKVRNLATSRLFKFTSDCQFTFDAFPEFNFKVALEHEHDSTHTDSAATATYGYDMNDAARTFVAKHRYVYLEEIRRTTLEHNVTLTIPSKVSLTSDFIMQKSNRRLELDLDAKINRQMLKTIGNVNFKSTGFDADGAIQLSGPLTKKMRSTLNYRFVNRKHMVNGKVRLQPHPPVLFEGEYEMKRIKTLASLVISQANVDFINLKTEMKRRSTVEAKVNLMSKVPQWWDTSKLDFLGEFTSPARWSGKVDLDFNDSTHKMGFEVTQNARIQRLNILSEVKAYYQDHKIGNKLEIMQGQENKFNVNSFYNDHVFIAFGGYNYSASGVGASFKVETPQIPNFDIENHALELTISGKKSNPEMYNGLVVVNIDRKETHLKVAVTPMQDWEETKFDIDFGFPDVVADTQNRLQLTGTAKFQSWYKAGLEMTLYTPVPGFRESNWNTDFELRTNRLTAMSVITFGNDKKVGFNVRCSKRSWKDADVRFGIHIPNRADFKVNGEYELKPRKLTFKLEVEPETNSKFSVNFEGIKRASFLKSTLVLLTPIEHFEKLEAEMQVTYASDDTTISGKFNGLGYTLDVTATGTIATGDMMKIDLSGSLHAQGNGLDIITNGELSISDQAGKLAATFTSGSHPTMELGANYETDSPEIGFKFDFGNDPHTFKAKVLSRSENSVKAKVEGMRRNSAMSVILDGTYNGLRHFEATVDSDIPQTFLDISYVPTLKGKVTLKHHLMEASYEGKAMVETETKQLGLEVTGQADNPYAGRIILRLPERNFLLSAFFKARPQAKYTANLEINFPVRGLAFFVHGLKIESEFELQPSKYGGSIKVFDEQVKKLELTGSVELEQPYTTIVRFTSPWAHLKEITVEASGTGVVSAFTGEASISVKPHIDTMKGTFERNEDSINFRLDVETPYENYRELFLELKHGLQNDRYVSNLGFGGPVSGGFPLTAKIDSDFKYNTWKDMEFIGKFKFPLLSEIELLSSFRGDLEQSVSTLKFTLADAFEYDAELNLSLQDGFHGDLTVYDIVHSRPGTPAYKLITDFKGDLMNMATSIKLLRAYEDEISASLSWTGGASQTITMATKLPFFDEDSALHFLNNMGYNRVVQATDGLNWSVVDTINTPRHTYVNKYSLAVPDYTNIEGSAELTKDGQTTASLTLTHRGPWNNFLTNVVLNYESRELFNGELKFDIREVIPMEITLDTKTMETPFVFSWSTAVGNQKQYANFRLKFDDKEFKVRARHRPSRVYAIIINTPFEKFKVFEAKAELSRGRGVINYEFEVSSDEWMKVGLNGEINVQNRVMTGTGHYQWNQRRKNISVELSNTQEPGKVESTVSVQLENSTPYKITLKYENRRNTKEDLQISISSPHDILRDALFHFNLQQQGLLRRSGIQAVKYNGKELSFTWHLNFRRIFQGMAHAVLKTPFENFEESEIEYAMEDSGINYHLKFVVGRSFKYDSKCDGTLAYLRCDDELITPFMDRLKTESTLEMNEETGHTMFKVKSKYGDKEVKFGFTVANSKSYETFIETPFNVLKNLELAGWYDKNGAEHKFGGKFNYNDEYKITAESAVEWQGEFRSNKRISLKMDVETNHQLLQQMAVENKYQDSEDSATFFFKLKHNNNKKAEETIEYRQVGPMKHSLSYTSGALAVSLGGTLEYSDTMIHTIITVNSDTTLVFKLEEDGAKTSGLLKLTAEGVDKHVKFDMESSENLFKWNAELKLEEAVYKEELFWRLTSSGVNSATEVMKYKLETPDSVSDGEYKRVQRSHSTTYMLKVRPEATDDYWVLSATSVTEGEEVKTEITVNDKWLVRFTNLHATSTPQYKWSVDLQNMQRTADKLTISFHLQIPQDKQVLFEGTIRHSPTKLDVTLTEKVNWQTNVWSMQSELKYQTVAGAYKTFKYQIKTDTAAGTVEFMIEGPRKKLALKGELQRSDFGGKLKLESKMDDSQRLAVEVALDSRVKSLDAKINYDPEEQRNVLHLYANEINETARLFEVYHIEHPRRVSDLRMVHSLIKPYLLQSDITWRPEMFEDIAERWESLKPLRRQKAIAFYEDLKDRLSTEMSNRRRVMSQFYSGPIHVVRTNFRKWQRKIGRELKKVTQIMRRSYRQDVYYIQTLARNIRELGEWLDRETIIVQGWMTSVRSWAAQRLDDAVQYAISTGDLLWDNLILRSRNINIARLLRNSRSWAEDFRTHYVNLLQETISATKDELMRLLSDMDFSALRSLWEQLTLVRTDFLNALINWSAWTRQELQNYASQTTEQVRQSAEWTSIKQFVDQLINRPLAEIDWPFNQLLNRVRETEIVEWNLQEGKILTKVFVPFGLESEDPAWLTNWLRKMTPTVNITPLPSISLVDAYYRYRYSLPSKPEDFVPPFKATAVISGDQHFVSFDGRAFEFNGPCSYLLARDMVHDRFSVVVNYKNQKRDSITVIGGNSEVEIKRDGKVFAEGVEKNLPLEAGAVTVIKDKASVLLRLGHDLEVICDQFVCKVQISGWLFGRTYGLLGVYNNEQYDDMMTPSRQLTDNIGSFATGWEVASSCSSHTDNAVHTSQQIDFCSEQFGLDSVMRPCFYIVNTTSYEQMCRNDLSVATGSESSASCESLATYVAVCNAQGVPIKMPGHCSTCDQSLTEETAPFDKANVVFVVEQKQCNKQIALKIKDFARRIKQTRPGSYFSLVTFGGAGLFAEPRVHTFNGATDTANERNLHSAITAMDFTDTLTDSDALAAISFSARLAFRNGPRSMVLLTCDQCMESDSYSAALDDLRENSITLHYMRKNPFSADELSYRPFGVSDNAVFSSRQRNSPPDTINFDKVTLPENDVCFELVKTTNGSTWNVERAQHSAFPRVAGTRISTEPNAPSCLSCQCIPWGPNSERKICKPCEAELSFFANWGFLSPEEVLPFTN